MNENEKIKELKRIEEEELKEFEALLEDQKCKYYAFWQKQTSSVSEKKYIAKLVKNILNSRTSGKNEDEVWNKAETKLLTAVLLYFSETNIIRNKLQPDGSLNYQWEGLFNLKKAAEMLQESNGQIKFEKVYSELKLSNPNSSAVEEYELFKLIPIKTALDVAVSVQLALNELLEKMSGNEGLIAKVVVYK